jgi:ATP-binding cassette subfamily B protein
MIHSLNMLYQRQYHFNDCGPACLVMIASCYQVKVSLTAMKHLCKTRLWGANLKGLLLASRELRFQAQAFKGDINKKNLSVLPSPFIAHVALSWWIIKIKHYVVVANITERYVEIWDPNYKVGIKKLTHAEFLRIWTGYVVIINHT